MNAFKRLTHFIGAALPSLPTTPKAEPRGEVRRPGERDRRRLLAGAAMITAAGPLGRSRTAAANGRAPQELAAVGRATEWLNSPQLAPASLVGKVVLVDFCTYTCINWLRTLPYVRAWIAKYQKRLVVIGVHTPEFEFERNVDNVRRAVRQLRIDYPVVIDNDYAIWRAFDNRYWPALYFIDGSGRLRHRQFGEGEYQRAERVIQRLLGEAGSPAGDPGIVSVDGRGVEAPPDWNDLRSPELYLGHDRTQNFASPGGAVVGRPHLYTAPMAMTLNQWALAGAWTVGGQAAVLNGRGGRLVCRFQARDLHLVMAPPRKGDPVRFRVWIDGRPPGPGRGGDVDESGHGVVVEPRLYQLVRQPKPIVARQFEIEFFDAGVETFAATFG
jgi:hypothetical protein